MKKIFFLLAIYSLFIISCGHKHSHEGHSHDHEHAETEHEGHSHDHEHEGEEGEHVHSEECTHDHENESDSHTEIPGTITFTKAQASKIDFSVENPVFEPLGQVIRTTAQIVSDQTDESIIAARTSGIVMFAGGNIVEGKNVGPGQVLFYVSGSGMAENNVNVRLTEAQSAYTKAEADYNRSQELAKDKIVSDKELRQIKS